MLEYCVQFWLPQYNNKLLECFQRPMKMVQGLEQKLYKEQLQPLGLFSPERKRLKGHITAVTTSCEGEKRGGLRYLFCGAQ